MAETSKIISKKAGSPPGALIHIGSQKTDQIKISYMDFNVDLFSEKTCEKIEECFPAKDSETIRWINIDGLHDTDKISSLGNHFELHPLLMEDVLNTRHRPKLEEFDNCLFLTLKMLGINKDGNSIISEQISFVLGKNWIISFQEQEGDIFDNIRMRLREKIGNVRRNGADYLLYRLVDTVVDNYFFVTEHISETTEKLGEKVLISHEQSTLLEIQHLKKQLIDLRKAVSPLREAIGIIRKDSNNLIEENTLRYLTDVYEHVIHVNDSIETQRDMIASLMDLYLSGVSNRMNQVMQMLTIIATIFIPLTFIAGIYGMNFEYMPELHWKYGYFVVWGIMLAIFVVMILFFKRKRWL